MTNNYYKVSIFLLCLGYMTSLVVVKGSKSSYSDHIILSHRWPVTECIEWMQKKDGNGCNIPPTRDWIIGGFWPYRYDSNLPVYCNKSLKVDEAVLKALKGQLLTNWPSVRSSTTNVSLWKEEYLAHGTCAYRLPILNSTELYFVKAMTEFRRYNMSNILTAHNIIPGNHYSVQQIFDAVMKGMKKIQPGIKRTYHNATKGLLLKEIYTCYSKTQGNIVDCVSLAGGLFQGCPKKQDQELIYFPSLEYPTPHKFSRALIAFLVILFGTLAFVGSFFGYSKYVEYRGQRNYDSMT
uniref:Ribonuclease T2 n=1 Tax=Lepeophtheirus salmonis TaxID=72036 RepID=C1BTV2_LEPSM|nr:Ribonuclease T2 precursor [Lepeophtheirus salmonis]ADD24549.1 Ribonuclease T2 [Lepeophtheirus salmonis]